MLPLARLTMYTRTDHPFERPFYPFNDGTGYTAFFHKDDGIDDYLIPFRHYSVSLQAAETDAKETIASGMADAAFIYRNSDWELVSKGESGILEA